MSGGVDDRVVALKFDNKQFEAASAQSMSTLDKLKKSLDFQNANKSLGGLQQTAGRFNLHSIATQVEGISTRFLAMGTIGVTALVGITQQALATGTALAKALTVDPLQSGYAEYSTNLNSIQTILSNTMAAGTNLKDVNGALAELNEYSDKTIYNFSEMARNIGTFTAAGVNLETSTNAIKGIANLAALSGSSAQQASTAMYQLSQAISTGTVKLIDWNSVSNAGMGGAVFQRALAKTAVNMGKLSKGAVTLSGDMETVTIKGNKFRDSLSAPETDGWLTSDVLTKTLAQFTGDMTDAQLAAEGWSKAEIKAIQKQALAATEAATQVKTVSQAFDVAKETAGSGWAKTWQIIFGNFETAKKDMTAFSQFLNGIINENADARNALLGAWSKAGGRIAAIQTLKAALEAFTQILNPIKKAWKEVFPPSTGQQLKDLTVTIRDFFRGLKLGPQQIEFIRVAFKGFFTLLSIGKQIFSGLFGFVKELFGLFTSGGGEAAGGLLEFASGLGANIILFNRWLKASNTIPAFFDRLYNAVGPTVVKIRDFVSTIKDAVGGALGQLPGMLDRLRGSALDADESGLTPLQKTTEKIAGGWDKLTAGLQSAIGFFQNFGSAVRDAFTGSGGIGTVVQENLAKINWPLIFKATVGTGFVAGVGLAIKGIWDAIDLILVTPKRIIKSFAGVLDGLGDALEGWGKKQAGQGFLMKAAGLLALAVALKVLSTINWPDLIVGIGAIKLLFMMLNSSMESMNDIGDVKSMAKIPIIAASFLILGAAMLVFALAIKVMSMIPTGDALKGLFTMSLVVLGLLGVAKVLEKAQGDILRFSAGLLIMSYAMIVFAGAIFLYSKMDPGTFFKGAAMIVGFVAALAVTMRLLPKEGAMLKAAAGLLLVAIALNLLIIPIKVLGAMDFDQMLNAIAGLGLMLAILVLALNAMTGTLAGAAAMLIASAALVVFGIAIQTLAEIGFGSVILGILGIVIAMAAIAGAAVLLAPAAIPMAIFGAALVVLGTGFFLLGAGALAFVTAISIIITIMSLGMPILEDTINNFIELIPLLAKAFQTFLEEFANAFTEAIPEMVGAIETLIREILASIERLIPSFQRVWSAMIKAGLVTLQSFTNDFINAGLKFIHDLLAGIEENLPGIIESGKNIVITWIKGMGLASLEIATAAGDAVLDFVEGVTQWIRDNRTRINNAGRDLAWEIINGFTGGLLDRLGDATTAVSGFFGDVIGAAQGALGIESPSKVFREIGNNVTRGFIIGVAQGKQGVIDSMAIMTDAIKQAKLDAYANIQDLKKKIADLKKEDPEGAVAKKANAAALAKAQADLAKAEAEKKKLDKAYLTITKERKKQIAQLVKLGKQYDTVKAKLDAAKDAYKAAIQERDDYAKNVADQYSNLPDIPDGTAVASAQANLTAAQKEYDDQLASGTATADELAASIAKIGDAQDALKEAQKASSLDAYFDKIRETTAANLKFKATLEELRKLGLDDNQYKKFMEQGTDIQPFLDQLLAAGGGTIAELNNIDATLTDSAESLGQSASQALYQAGVDSAKGLVDGLTANLAAITEKMKTIGKAIADEIKKELGIASPSKVFKQIGKNTVLGLALGLDKNAGIVSSSAQQLGQTAIDSLKASMTGLTDVLANDLEMNPTIAPVLDLDAFRKDSAKISDILDPSAIKPITSATTATAISNEADLQAKLNAEMALVSAGNIVEFTQNNISPKALSTAEIYRQSKNLLSITKGALDQ